MSLKALKLISTLKNSLNNIEDFIFDCSFEEYNKLLTIPSRKIKKYLKKMLRETDKRILIKYYNKIKFYLEILQELNIDEYLDDFLYSLEHNLTIIKLLI
jgi:hypothetical protein